jgi:phage shock protein PspC (stress-responsive transcriptional regulator)
VFVIWGRMTEGREEKKNIVGAKYYQVKNHLIEVLFILSGITQTKNQFF